jgi:hypothetical protein
MGPSGEETRAADEGALAELDGVVTSAFVRARKPVPTG